MLKLLIINNLAVVDRLQIEFGPGLNVLTGETGSGKSIIIDAVELLLGGRASSDAIRSGVDRASVEGIFSVAGNAPLLAALEGAGIDVDEGEIIVRREIATTGRGRAFINNQPTTTALLRTIHPHLLDLHGQGDQQSLTSSAIHSILLDSFLDVMSERQAIEDVYRNITQVLAELEEVAGSEAARLQEADMVEFQLREIESAQIAPDEDSALEAEHSILANADRISRICGEAYSRLYEDEAAVLSNVGAAARRLSEIASLDPRIQANVEQLTSIRFGIEEIAFFLRDYLNDIQVSPSRLAAVEDRLALLERLKRKYGGTLANIEEKLAALRAKAETLAGSEEAVSRLSALLAGNVKDYDAAAAKLSQKRRKNASRFEKDLVAELKEVALEKARFEVRFGSVDAAELATRLSRFSLAGPSGGRYGNEQAQFYFSANPGEDLRPLHQVASGGELSRLMLVIKNVVSPSNFPRTLIFDEIDAGIGGRVADAVGLRLKRLANTNQVLCVTHQAQIARYADTHFQISKEVAADRTTTKAVELKPAGRVEELARMIAGADVTPLARKHARELLRSSDAPTK